MTRRFLIAVLMCAALGVPAAARDVPPAQPPFLGVPLELVQSGQDRARDGVRRGEYVSLDRILANVRREVPGRQVGVDGPNARGLYRIRWLTPDGEVLIVVADAHTGEIVRIRGGR